MKKVVESNHYTRGNHRLQPSSISHQPSAIMKSSPNLYLILQCLYAFSSVNGQTTKVGCFSSSNGLTSLGYGTYQSSAYCVNQCSSQSKAVAATSKGSDCWCGDKLPPQNSETDDSSCSSKCQGFPGEMCGGPSAWSVYLTGSDSNPGYYSGSGSGGSKGSSSSSSASSYSSSSTDDSDSAASQTKTAASVVTRQSTLIVTAAGGQTLVQTAVATTTAQSQSKGPNTAGIAAGVVVGVVVVGAVAGGIFFLLRRQKKKAEEEELSKNGAIGSYSNLKPSPSSAGSMSDSRLEPSVMMQRRQSDGSIADNQDYSRRILKVRVIDCGTRLD